MVYLEFVDHSKFHRQLRHLLSDLLMIVTMGDRKL